MKSIIVQKEFMARSLKTDEQAAPKTYLITYNYQTGDQVLHTYTNIQGKCTKVYDSKDRAGKRHCVIEWREPGDSEDQHQQCFSHYFHCKDWFKVIGEISNYAHWVKEGSQFDAYEQWWYGELTFGKSDRFLFPIHKCIPGDQWESFRRDGCRVIKICKVKCSVSNSFY